MTSAGIPRHRKRCARTLAFPPSPYVPSSDGNTSAMRTGSPMTNHAAITLERGVVRQYLDPIARGPQGAGEIVDTLV